MARTRENSTAYVLNDIVVPATLGTRYYTCTKAGTSDSSEPAGITSTSTAEGEYVSDGTAVWQCHVCKGGSGMMRITDYSDTYSITFTNRNLMAVRTLGKSNVFHNMTTDEPRAHDRRSASDVLQITANLFNTSAASESNTLVKRIFKPQAGTDYLTIEFTGVWDTLYDSPWYVQPLGSSACKITPVLGKRAFIVVNIQVREIKT